MPKVIKALFLVSIFACIMSIILIIITYFVLKPDLPEIKYVDESELQLPLKVFSKDGILIGEFGEIKRRAKTFDEIPYHIKSAFWLQKMTIFLIIKVLATQLLFAQS